MRLTVDCNRHAFVQDKSIFALKGRNFAKGVNLEIFLAHTFTRILGNQLDLEVICLCNSQKHGCAGVLLKSNFRLLIKMSQEKQFEGGELRFKRGVLTG